MAHSDRTYVIFDADNDMWAYQFMRGWSASKNIPFNFDNAHDIKPLREDAFLESTIKARLKERFAVTHNAIVLVGSQTKYLFRFVRWEIETALSLNLPIIAVNLNDKRRLDPDLCPPLLKGQRTIHVAFKARIIKHAMDTFSSDYRDPAKRTWSDMFYGDEVYRSLGISV